MTISIYVTLIPVIIAGVWNMLFVKTGLYKRLKHPIDKGRCLKDGKRIFGDHKTWIGFVSMIFFAMCAQLLWGLLCSRVSNLEQANYLYRMHANGMIFNVLAGALFGLSYMLFELPNSFIKRRCDIRPGKTEKGIRGFFFLLDQVDSLFGVALVLALFYPMSIAMYLYIVFLGGITHIAVNGTLFILKIRKNL